MNTIAHNPSIAEVAETDPRKALTNPVPTCAISKPTEPVGEWLAAVRAGVDSNILLGRPIEKVA